MSQQHQKWILEDQYLPHHNSLLVISVLASITNGILLYRFCVNRYYLKPAHMSLVSISLSDFVSAFGGLVAFAMHSVNRELPWYWCQYSGVFCCITGASALSFCVMGVERYCQIVLNKTFRRAHISLILIICWIFSLFLAFFPIIVQTYHVPQSAPVYCLPNFTGRTALHYIVSLSSIIAITSVIGINSLSYYLIYKKAIADGFKWSSTLRSTHVGGSADNESRQGGVHSAVASVTGGARMPKNSAQRKQMKLTIKLATVTLSFCITWLGTGISFTYQTISGHPISPNIDVFCTATTLVFAVINPLMVLTMDRRWKIDIPFAKYVRRSNHSSNETVNTPVSSAIKQSASMFSKSPA